MSHMSGRSESRRELLRQSLRIEKGGGITTHGARLMAKPLRRENHGMYAHRSPSYFRVRIPSLRVGSKKSRNSYRDFFQS